MFLFLLLSTLHSSPSLAAASLDPLSQEYKLQQLTEFTEAANDVTKIGRAASTWADVKFWKPVGKRFAAAYNTDKDLVAIYDLSYPKFGLSMLLGKISHSATDTSRMHNAFVQAQNGVYSADISASAQRSIAGIKNVDTILKSAYLHDDWWKTLPWKSASFVSAEPASFRITDLDLAKLNIGTKLTSGLRTLFQAVLNDSGDLNSVSDTDLLNSFQFVRAQDNGYEIRFTDPRNPGAVSRPRKLLELVNVHQGLYDNIKVALLGMVLSQATSAIPIPVVSALISTALSRFERYYSMTEVEHLEMFHELITQTEEGSLQDGVLTYATDYDLATLQSAFEWTRVSPTDVWRFIFTHPDKAWSNGQTSDTDRANKSRAWLTLNHSTVTDLGKRFSFGVNSNQAKSLYLDSAVVVSRNKGPTLSINYANPDAIAKDRLEKEWIGIGIEFASNFIPVAGFAVNEAYSLLVQNPIDNAQYWEARLLQNLESSCTNFDFEISKLQNQRINPLEIDHAAMEQLVQARGQQIGL